MTTTLDADLTVETFANAVRGELFDLDAESIEDLTDGLEADLADKLADGEELGDPAAYAAELRAAAGLHPRRRRVSARQLTILSASLAGAVAQLREFVTRQQWLAAPIAFATALRPLWWIFRAWVVFGFFNLNWMWGGVPSNWFGWLVFLALCLVSVQWGRRKWLPWRWSRGFVIVLSAGALLVAPYVVGTSLSQANYQIDPNDFISEGILLDREQVTNIFAYDSDGQPLTGVQLFDQNGNPLTVVPDYWDYTYLGDDTLTESRVLIPREGAPGRPGWNVFPLEEVDYSAINPETGRLAAWAKPSPVQPPFASVQPLSGSGD